MKVLLTCESYLPRVGGAEIHVMNLFQRLLINGHDVNLVTNEAGTNESNVTRIPWSKKRVFELLSETWKQTNNVNLIHAHYCHRLAFIVGVIGKFRGIPVLITLHGMGILDHPGASYRARLSHGFYRYWSLQLCTHVISTSEDLALVADRYISRKKMTVIMNGFDSKLFSPRHVNKMLNGVNFSTKKIILSVRRLVPKNGLHYMVQAMPYILKKIPNAHFVLAGDGILRPYIEQQVKELVLEDHVTFLGMVDNSAIFNYLACSDVVVFPSTAESSSIACAEAMGMGKSVVASRVGGLVELLGVNQERGYLVDLVPWTGSNYNAPLTLPEESYQNLANGITKALLNTLESKEKSAIAENYARKELSWDAIYTKTLDIYNKV